MKRKSEDGGFLLM